MCRFLLASLLLCAVAGGAEPVAIDWAKARQHWSYVLPKMHALPTVNDAKWPRARVDHFILAAMEKNGLQPSSKAEPRSLLRRLFFDLNGLPPAPEEMRAFLADSTPGAYERLVDDLLGRRAFGERMASLWLNLARYAEDQAHQVGNNTSLNLPNAWRYRDWVVAAFNADVPH
ncbi:MAG: DUF1549 domain-containing protein, partial [Verrucomicrobiaceae bacterium]|nr:DUF1549 domain-containing protein [Verrucomicrobiaceae bacterium]